MKKRKIQVSEIPTYYNFVRHSIGTIKGYLYYLSDKQSEENKKEIEDKYNNVIWLTARPQFAPELKTNVLFVSDRVLAEQTLPVVG